jgi:hypothetical protein
MNVLYINTVPVMAPVGVLQPCATFFYSKLSNKFNNRFKETLQNVVLLSRWTIIMFPSYNVCVYMCVYKLSNYMIINE